MFQRRNRTRKNFGCMCGGSSSQVTVDLALQTKSYRKILDGRQNIDKESRVVIPQSGIVKVELPLANGADSVISLQGPVTLARLLRSIDGFYLEHGGKSSLIDMAGGDRVQSLHGGSNQYYVTLI